MKMFTPFAFRSDELAPPTPKAAAGKDDPSLAEIKRQMAAMQAQIAALSKK